MDRSQTLRQMMKERLSSPGGNTLKSIASSSSSVLEAKDKAKLLKQVRLQQIPSSLTSVTPHRADTLSTSLQQPSQVNKSNSNFAFSENTSFQQLSDSNTRVQVAVESLQPPKSTSIGGNLPMGFFDDPFADLKAHGLDPKKVLQDDKDAQEKNLSEFFTEVKKLDHLEEEVEEVEVKDLEEEEKALQMSYELKLAKLYKAADSVKSKSLNASSSHISDESWQVMHSYLPNVTDTSDIDNGASNDLIGEKRHITSHISSADAEVSIERIVKHSRNNKRNSMVHKVDTLNDSDDYVTLDCLNDWTSKSIR